MFSMLRKKSSTSYYRRYRTVLGTLSVDWHILAASLLSTLSTSFPPGFPQTLAS